MRVERALLQLPVRFCAETMAEEIRRLPKSAWIPHPQGYPGNDAVPLVSPHGEIGDRVEGPMAATSHLAQLPYISSVMAELGCVWGRSRLMGLGPGAEVKRHVDIHYYWRTHVRIHIPIITNPGVCFTCGNESTHMAAGECWVFNSFEVHDVQNRGAAKRVHLVLDTVGGTRLWDLVKAAEAGAPIPDRPPLTHADPSPRPLAFEQVNAPKVMSPYEMRSHIAFLQDYIVESPLVGPVREQTDRFVAAWEGAWAQFGDSDRGLPVYQELLSYARNELAIEADRVKLRNGPSLGYALDALVFWNAVSRV